MPELHQSHHTITDWAWTETWRMGDIPENPVFWCKAAILEIVKRYYCVLFNVADSTGAGNPCPPSPKGGEVERKVTGEWFKLALWWKLFSSEVSTCALELNGPDAKPLIIPAGAIWQSETWKKEKKVLNLLQSLVTPEQKSKRDVRERTTETSKLRRVSGRVHESAKTWICTQDFTIAH